MATESTLNGESYFLGNQLLLRLYVRQNGNLVDPAGEITLSVEIDDAPQTDYIYNGGAGDVVREAEGIYNYPLDLAADGTYEWRWKTVNPNGATEGYFIVPVSRMASP